jgi:RHS repeat-associated protein
LSYERKADAAAAEQPVFFDNLVVQHYTGALTAENTYYPYGLSMAALSSRAVGKVENKYKFNDGTELNNDFDISLYETNYRSLDPQIGRFWQIDPLADIYHNQSPYVFANNNPILFNDPLGLYGDTSWKQMRDVTVVPVTPIKTPAADPNTTLSPQQNPARGFTNPPFVFTPVAPSPTPTPSPAPEPGIRPYILPALVPAAILTSVFTFIPKTGGAQPLAPDQIHEALFPKPQPVFDPYPGHGNDDRNWNAHIVYEFSFTPAPGDKRTPILKYGISDLVRNGFDRPELQLPWFMAQYGASVKLLIIDHVANRAQAKAVEQQKIDEHDEKWNEMPRRQLLPKPSKR